MFGLLDGILYKEVHATELRMSDGSYEFRVLERNRITGTMRTVTWTPDGEPIRCGDS